MYLTDYRERSLKDVITQLEPELFKKVTGLDTKDFEILCSIGVFNASLMNEAIFKFKRYEDSSLSYTGINMHGKDEEVGGWDTSIKKEEYNQLFINQQDSMNVNIVVDTEEEANVKNAQEEHERISRVIYDNSNRKTYVKPKEEIADEKKQEILNKLDELDIDSFVTHKKFGVGVITWIDSKRTHIKIRFESGEKQFIYPDAFIQGHLEIK